MFNLLACWKSLVSTAGLWAIVLTFVMGALHGCSTTRPIADSAPPPISADAIVDAQPRPDPLLAAGNTSPYTINGETYTVLSTARGYSEQGIASWYGLKFHGRKTANGEQFNVYGPTAAHKSLPIPSYVRVVNLENQRTMVLRVNDRGPFHPDRIIDLSYGAALKLGFADQGTARVLVEALDIAGVDDRRGIDTRNEVRYRFLQLGAFSSPAAADALRRRVLSIVLPMVKVPVEITNVDTNAGRLYRLRAGPFDSESQLDHVRRSLDAAGLSRGQPLP